MAYRYIGKGITDSNGIAHLTEDAEGQTVTGYTGTGRGLTDIIASLDDRTKISEGSLQSETYGVIDAMWKDMGTTSDHNDNWVFSNISTDVRSRLSDGTKIDVSNATLTANVLLTMGTTNQYQNYVPNDYVLEFDILEVDTRTIRIKSVARDTSTGHKYPSIDLNQYTAPYTVKVVFNKDFCDFYVDNNLVGHNTYSDSQYNRPFFEILNGDYGKFLKYANMRIYPI